MSLTKYRIVTRLADDATREYYQIQEKGWFFWRDSRDGYGYSRNYAELEWAKARLHDIVAADEASASLSAKHKAFKSKVVYGPYPP